MSAHAFALELIALGFLLSLALFSGPISAAALSFFYGSSNRRVRK
jgi:uncharacterized membrane protein